MGKLPVTITESVKNIKNAEIKYKIENITLRAKDLFGSEINGPIRCLEQPVGETHKACYLALALDSSKSVYEAHYSAEIGTEKLSFFFTLERKPDSLLVLSVGLLISFLVLISLIGFVVFMWIKSKSVSSLTDAANETNDGMYVCALTHCSNFNGI